MSGAESGSVVAVIPARRGSKRLPDKNLLPVAGRPMLAWTIDAALGSAVCRRVLVSTEDPEIAEIARGHGADVPFLRPRELAGDDVPGIQAVVHALRWIEERDRQVPEYAVCLQPTSPLRTAADVAAAVALARDRRADSVVSVTPSRCRNARVRRLTADGRLADAGTVGGDGLDDERLYELNGAIYLGRRETIVRCNTYYTGRTYAYVMPLERSLDIDSAWDLRIADLVLREGAGRAAG